MGKNYVHFAVQDDVKESIMTECRKVFLEAHPERTQNPPTQWEMIRILRNYYLGRKFYE